MKIEIASESDTAAWLALRKALWPDCSDARHRIEVRHLLDSNGIVALAKIENHAQGFAELSIRTDHVEGASESPIPYLEGWYVAPEYRGIGLGKALMQFIDQWARDHGYQELASDAELDNISSIQIHKYMGFKEVGRTVHFTRSLKAI